jgi:pimeloyl-ACP methyl ester carboxylesterase
MSKEKQAVTPHIVLVHGLWMRGPSMSVLARHLTALSYSVESFDYHSVGGGPEAAVSELAEVLARSKAEQVHVVGHSLGGLIALETVRQYPYKKPGRVVCMGSPLSGSQTAKRLSLWPGGTFLLGKSGAWLQKGVAAWDQDRQVGVIAGTTPLGIGLLVNGFLPESDGTVTVSETRLPGITDHCVMSVTHTGMVLSAQVAKQVDHFLRQGHFEHKK